MAKTEGISRYTCDRCSKEMYMTAGDPRTSEWRDIERVTADAVTVKRLLCPECTREYKALAEDQDASFAAFMRREG